MKFEEEDYFDPEEFEESMLDTLDEQLLTELAELLAECLRTNPAMYDVLDELLDVVSDLAEFSGELVGLSRWVYYTARNSQEDGDLLGSLHEFYACSESILDSANRSNTTACLLMWIVRDLVRNAVSGGYHG